MFQSVSHCLFLEVWPVGRHCGPPQRRGGGHLEVCFPSGDGTPRGGTPFPIRPFGRALGGDCPREGGRGGGGCFS